MGGACRMVERQMKAGLDENMEASRETCDWSTFQVVDVHESVHRDIITKATNKM